MISNMVFWCWKVLLRIPAASLRKAWLELSSIRLVNDEAQSLCSLRSVYIISLSLNCAIDIPPYCTCMLVMCLISVCISCHFSLARLWHSPFTCASEALSAHVCMNLIEFSAILISSWISMSSFDVKDMSFQSSFRFYTVIACTSGSKIYSNVQMCQHPRINNGPGHRRRITARGIADNN